MKYNNSSPEPLIKRLFKGWGYYIMGVIMNLWFVTVMTGLMMENIFIKLIVGIAAEIIVNGLFFNYAYNAAKLDRNLVKLHGMERDRFMSAKIAAFAPLPGYVMFIMLAAAKAGAFAGTSLGQYGFNYYIMLNLHTLPWIAMVTDGRSMEFLSYGGLAGLLLLQLLQPAVIVLTYEFTFRDIDVFTKLLYGKNAKK